MEGIVQEVALLRVSRLYKPHQDPEILTRLLLIPVVTATRNGLRKSVCPTGMTSCAGDRAGARIEKDLLNAVLEEAEIHVRWRRAGSHLNGRRGSDPLLKDLPLGIVLGLPKLATDVIFGATRIHRQRLAKKNTVLREPRSDETRYDLEVMA
jgi:hypothetical protein